MAPELIPVLLSLFVAAGVSFIALALSSLLGKRFRLHGHYDSGVPDPQCRDPLVRPPGGNLRLVVVSIVFLVLCSAIGLLVVSAVTFSAGGETQRWVALVEMLVFLIPLVLGYIWLGQRGVFDSSRRGLSENREAP